MHAQGVSRSALSGTPAVNGSHHHIGEIVRRTAGLRVREQDFEALSRWTAERARALALPGIDHYGELLAEDSAAGRRERELLTVQFTTGESYFFRDQGQFDLLAATILLELIERRANERRLRIWSAGCAAGEEAYSLAMLVNELAPRLAGWNVLILGTDINAEALKKARRGVYDAWSFRALDARRKQRHFRPSGNQWQIDARLRDTVTFRCGDLVRDRFPDADADLHDFDLILCRNVFIYLDAGAVGRITAKFAASLADGGILITGHSELFGHDTAPLRVRMFPQSAVFQKTAQPAAEISLGEALRKAQAMIIAAPRPLLPVEVREAPAEQRRVPAPPPAAPAEDRDRLMQSAWRHADRGMHDEAQDECRKAIAIGAFDPRPYYLLAQLAQERGDVMQAKTLLKKVTYLEPSFIAAYLELGALHAQAGENERARRMYETARTALRKLPAETPIAPYNESTAAGILAHVGRLLGESAGEAAGGAAAQARPHQSA
jgi:chemotaxis protein methyltransferase CheR